MQRAALLLLVLSATPAAAFDPTGNVVADAFLSTLERGGYGEVRADGVRRDGGAIVLDGVSATAAPEVGQTLTIGTVAIAGGAVNGDNALVADRITYGSVAVTDADGGTTSTIGSVTIERPLFSTDAAEPVTGVTTLLGAFDHVELADVVANAPDRSPVRVRTIAATVDERDIDRAAAGSFAVSGLVFDVSAWDEPAESQMKALGYAELSMDLSGKGRWEAATGRAVVEGLTVGVADLGTLTLDAAMDGLTRSALAGFQGSGGDMAQLLPLLQAVTLSGITLRYVDAGLTPRLVADAAKRASVPPEALVQGLVATIPDALAILGSPAFTEKVAAAAETFLNSPGTLLVRATPAEPVSMAQVVGAALMSPASLPGLLNLDVSAER